MSILKKLMKDKGYTKIFLAEKSGVSVRTLEPYIAGSRKFCNTPLWLAVKIADALDVDVHVLMEELHEKDITGRVSGSI